MIHQTSSAPSRISILHSTRSGLGKTRRKAQTMGTKAPLNGRKHPKTGCDTPLLASFIPGILHGWSNRETVQVVTRFIASDVGLCVTDGLTSAGLVSGCMHSSDGSVVGFPGGRCRREVDKRSVAIADGKLVGEEWVFYLIWDSLFIRGAYTGVGCLSVRCEVAERGWNGV